jgi:CrcB protein
VDAESADSNPRSHTGSPPLRDPRHASHPSQASHSNPQTAGRVRARTAALRHDWDVLVVIAAGGVAGAEARYGVSLAVPHTDRQFPWSTLIINVSGCLAIGVLMVLLLELTSPHRLARPFLGVGLLGGYTTYSTFSVEAERLVRAHRPGLALWYVTATVLGCMLAVWIGTVVTQLAGGAVMNARTRRLMRRGER